MARKSFASKMSEQLNPTATPPTQPIPGREAEMVKMRSGGYGFKQDDWDTLYSVLILGNQTGSYYASADELQKEHAELLKRLIQQNPQAVLNAAFDVSVHNLTLKNLYPVYALAALVKFGDAEIRRAVYENLPKIARTGSDFLAFAQFCDELDVKYARLNSRGLSHWYISKAPEPLAYQLLKYQNRHGMSHERVFRLAHVGAWANRGVSGPLFAKITDWLKTGHVEQFADVEGFTQVMAYEDLKNAETVGYVVELIKKYRFTHEMIPSKWLKERAVWVALLEGMPYTALIRNLGRLAANDVFMYVPEVEQAVAKITDVQAIIGSRVHPLAILKALVQFAEGKGEKGSLTWHANPKILDALDKAFYFAMQNQLPREANILVIADVSGSMKGKLSSMNLYRHQASAAMMLTAMHRYSNVDVLAVDTGLYHPAISARQRLDDAGRELAKRGGGGTALNIAFEYITAKKKAYDGVIFITDTESWASSGGSYYGRGQHTSQAWQKYRQSVNAKARCLFIATDANGYTVADPKDRSVRTASGFDASIFRQFELMLDGVI
jgi:60 kDa SS-A/Ro ribonucleoprotein